MESSQRLSYLFHRYLENNCTPQEKEEFFALIGQAEHDDTLRRLIADTWNEDLPAYHQDKARADTLLRHIISRREPESPSAAAGSASRIFTGSFRLRAILFNRWAAAVLVIVLLSTLTLYYRHGSTSTSTVLLPRPSLAVQHPPADRCITLPDGSKVLLHKTAQLDFRTGFSATLREVTLHGEAYFDIRRDTRPFIVHTGAIRTTVLGTAFNIDANNEQYIVITVTKGKVKVENGKGEYSILRRNEQLSVDSAQNHLQKMAVDAGEALVWKKTYLLFNDVPMREAMDELAQRYHLSIVFTNPAAENCPVTASFTGGESPEQMINVLSKINNMEYTIDHGRIAITGEGCK
jgi:transmembrane sensor